MLINRGRVLPGERLLATLHNGQPSGTWPGDNRVVGHQPVLFSVPADGEVTLNFGRARRILGYPWIAIWRADTMELAGVQRIEVTGRWQFIPEGDLVVVHPTIRQRTSVA